MKPEEDCALILSGDTDADTLDRENVKARIRKERAEDIWAWARQHHVGIKQDVGGEVLQWDFIDIRIEARPDVVGWFSE